MKIPPTLVCQLNDARARLQISEADVTKLLSFAAAGDVPRFEQELRRLEATSDEHTAGTEPNAFEVHKTNPALLGAMRACGVTAADVATFGPRKSLAERTVPNLRELADNTDARGDRMGTGK